MLSKENKELLRSKIVLKLKGLEDDIVYLKELTKPISPENAIGRISRMDAINNKSVNEAALRTSVERQLNLKRALENIDLKHFGLCNKCGNPIELGRLLIIPEGRMCMQCLKH